MHRFNCRGLIALLLTIPAFACAAEPRIRFGREQTKQFRVGFKVDASAGAVTGIVATMAVPMDWPEQTVTVVSEEISSNCKVTYRNLDGGVKQMVVNIPRLAKGDKANVEFVYECKLREILPPESTA